MLFGSGRGHLDTTVLCVGWPDLKGDSTNMAHLPWKPDYLGATGFSQILHWPLEQFLSKSQSLKLRGHIW